jgi:hypothetical protein
MVIPLALLLPLSPGFASAAPAAPAAQAAQAAQAPSGGDPSRRFPLRREGGGTRTSCAARLVAHLVPQDGHFDPGPGGILGVIEGEASRAPRKPLAPLVLRWRDGWQIEPARSDASLRLVRLAGPPVAGEWFSFPACEGTAEPSAPPASSQLRPSPTGPSPAAVAARAADAGSRVALAELWRHCGGQVASQPLLAFWDFPHLADQLPASLPVLCSQAPPTAPRSPLPAHGR